MKRTKKQAKKKVKRQGRKRNRSVKKFMGTSYTKQAAAMISNPCHGPIVRTVGEASGGTLLERFRATYAITDATATCGYFVWYPSYHGASSGTYRPSSLFAWASTDVNAVPLNSTASPLGTSTLTTTGLFLSDPVHVSLTNGVFSRAKTLAACMQLEYLGSVSSTAGQVAIVSNYSLQAFDRRSGTAGTLIAPTVDQIFGYANVRKRLSLDGHEVVFRPNERNSVYRGTAVEAAGFNVETEPDAVFWSGSAGAAPSKICATDTNFPNGICIAWRGVPAGNSNISLNVVKVADMQIAPTSNAIEMPYSQTSVSQTATSVDEVTSLLDQAMPGWQVRTVQMASNAAAMSYNALAGAVGALTASRAISSRLRGPSQHLLRDGEL